MDARKVLGKNVRRIREKRGLSQESLSELTGIHRTYVSGVERGVRNPTVLIVAALARALGVKPSDLLDDRS